MRKEEKPDILKAGSSRPLSASEQAHWEAYLDQHPLEADKIESELGLNRLLRELPDQSLSSNFTAQVMEAVRGLERPLRTGRWTGIDWNWFRPSLRWARPAIVSMLVLGGVLAWRQYEAQHQSRERLAMSVAAVSEVTSVITVDMLRDFDAIHQLSQVPVEVDMDLLQALE